MITTKAKIVLVLISLLLIGVIVYLSLGFIKHKNSERRIEAIRQANYQQGCPGEVPRYPIINTSKLIEILGRSSNGQYVIQSPKYHSYLYFQILVHEEWGHIMEYQNDNLDQSKYKASCYKFYRISPGEDEFDDILSLNLREGKELYSFILTPAQNREIIQKVIDDKLMDLPRLDNIDILTVLNQFDKEYKTICVSNTSIHTLDEESKPKIEAFIAWFEGKFYDELKKHPVDIFPSDIPARAPYNTAE